jgi:hypothetical protein
MIPNFVTTMLLQDIPVHISWLCKDLLPGKSFSLFFWLKIRISGRKKKITVVTSTYAGDLFIRLKLELRC